MTERERQQTVTLLHLAAVLADEGCNWPPILCEAEKMLGFGHGSINEPSEVCLRAQHACAAANDGYALGCAKDRAAVCRDAAVLIAQGRWP